MSTWPEEFHVHWFGEDWGAPINEDCPKAETPTGLLCLFCHYRIEADDRGVMMPLGQPQSENPSTEYRTTLPETGPHPWIAQHYGCHMESLLGPGWRTMTRWPQV